MDLDNLQVVFKILGQQLYLLAHTMDVSDIDVNSYNYIRYPTQFDLQIHSQVHILVEIRPFIGEIEGFEPIDPQEIRTSSEVLKTQTLNAKLPDYANSQSHAHVMDYVRVYRLHAEPPPRPETYKRREGKGFGKLTALGYRGELLFAGSRPGALGFYSQYFYTQHCPIPKGFED